jgi:hypothetical protein
MEILHFPERTPQKCGVLYLAEYFIILDFLPPHRLKEKKISNR